MQSDTDFMAELRQHVYETQVDVVRLSAVKRIAKRRRAAHRAGPAVAAVVAAVSFLVVRPPIFSGPTPQGDAPWPTEPSPTGSTQCVTPSECFSTEPDGWSLDAQTRLAVVAASIHDVADDEPGFGGITYTYEPEGLVLRWAGDLPARVSDVVETARADGVAVEVEQTAYGEEELLGLSVEVAKRLVAEGIPFASVGAAADGGAIEIHGVAGALPSVCDDAVARARTMEIARAIAGDVPVLCGTDEELAELL